MQHRSNVPTGFDISFIWWLKSDYVATHGMGRLALRKCTVGTFDDLSSRKIACSIPVHHQSKPEIVPSRTCAEVFSCPLKNEPKSVSIIYPISKIASMNNNFPTLKVGIHPPKDCWTFSSVTWKHIISIPWKQCTSFFCLCWSRRITTLAYQQKPVLCTVYKTACGLAVFFGSHLYPENIQVFVLLLSNMQNTCKDKCCWCWQVHFTLSSLLSLNFEPWQHSSETLKCSELCFCSNVHYNIICI